MSNIEDWIFASALEALKIKLHKNMYERTLLPHVCSMCGDDNDKKEVGYKLKLQYRDLLENGDFFIDYPPPTTPYLFICNECYDLLPE